MLLSDNTFSIWMQFTVVTSKMSEHPRGMRMATRMQELQASWRGNQLNSRVENHAQNRAPSLVDLGDPAAKMHRPTEADDGTEHHGETLQEICPDYTHHSALDCVPE
jgi:hypothetical protein